MQKRKGRKREIPMKGKCLFTSEKRQFLKEKKKKNSSKTPRDRGNLQKDSTHPKEQRAFGKKGIVQKAKRPLHLHKFFRLFEYTCTETKALAAQNPPSRQMHRLCASGSLRVWPPQAAKSAGKKGDTKKTSDFGLTVIRN